MLEDLCDATISIKLSPSEDGECSELPCPLTEKEGFRLKCFRCFGRADPRCPECQGTENVHSTHPLAFLLGQVLNRKLQLPAGGGRVCPIKEEEEEAEGGKGGCVVCATECAMKEGEASPAAEESNCWEGPIDLSGCVFPQQDKRCHHCDCPIENCYSACRTCLGEGRTYWLCDACSDSHCFTHPADHLLEPVIYYDELKDKIETISQEYEEESNENDFPDDQLPALDKKNSSIANHLEEDYDFMGNSGEARESRVKFEIEGLFSSYDFKSIKKLEKGQFDRKSNGSSKSKGKSRATKENLVVLRPSPLASSHPPPHPPASHYAFVDYKCDFCEMQPILNVRYHCRACEDYDLCEKCYEDCDSIHEHQAFDCIDGRRLREKAVERLFQLRDTNLRATCMPEKESIKSTFYPTKPTRTKTQHFNSEHLAQ